MAEHLHADAGLRNSRTRERHPGLPRLGPLIGAASLVSAIVVALHFLFA